MSAAPPDRPALSAALLGPPDRTGPLAAALAAAGLAASAAPERADVVLVASPPGEQIEAARASVERGAHVFLAWPPGIAVDEVEALARLAEEAGVEVGVARPLDAPALLSAREAVGPARLVTLSLIASESARGLGALPWPQRIAGALDLCAALVATHDPLRVDAEAERDGRALRAVVLGLRFRNGAYAQASLRASAHASADEVGLYAAGPLGHAEARHLHGPLCLDDGAPALAPPPDADAVAFVRAVAAGRPAPYGLHAALATLRLTHRVLDRLR